MSDKKVSPKAKVNPDDVASAPQHGGRQQPGKDSSDCDDSRGNPGKHRGEATQAVVVSGKGPSAAKRQVGTAGWN